MKKPGKRPYQQRKRAQSQIETRARIIEATMALHEERGPRAASISAIAERAGVQRLTVYRHFPDEDALFHACTSTWLERNPPPDLQAWASEEDAAKRVLEAMEQLYRYYEKTERMWDVSHRDVDQVEALREPMAAFRAYTEAVAEDLAARWRAGAPDPSLVDATLRHAVRFSTWVSLHAEGLEAAQGAAVVLLWLKGVFAQPAGRAKKARRTGPA